MTKVRTLLAEFCSPKKIQTINRLGLLKKEERESQPVPWRHRLRGLERRELVLSEMRKPLRPPSILAAREKAKAVTAARHLIDSKMGECMLKTQSRQDPSLGSRLGKLKIEEQRLSRAHQQAREKFIKQSKTINLDPIILVQRPALDHTILSNKEHTGPQTSKTPGYMRPLRSRKKAPSNLPTIEAFILETRKKRNVWDEVLDQKQASRFKSATMPSIRLSGEEVYILKLGHSLHKPSPESGILLKSAWRKGYTHPKADGGNALPVFITQLPEKDSSRTNISPPISGAEMSNDKNINTSSSQDQNIISEVGNDKPLSAQSENLEGTNIKHSINEGKRLTDQRATSITSLELLPDKHTSLELLPDKHTPKKTFLKVLLDDRCKL